MLSSSLLSIYQQYKRDTEVVATWLATTAREHGYDMPLGLKHRYTQNPIAAQEPAPAAKKGPRKRGPKKKKDPAPAASAPPKQEQKYVLAIRDFAPLAEHIASVPDNVIKIPEWFEVALERVIWVRDSFAGKLQQTTMKTDAASDERHKYFIEVLRSVKKTLQPLIPEWTSKPARFSAKPAVVNEQSKTAPQVQNFFHLLEVYEPSAAFETAPDVEVPPSVGPLYTIEDPVESMYEALFALSTLLGDLSRLREEVAELWKKYETGKLELSAVSVATDTAIALARTFEEPVIPLMEKYDGITVLHMEFFAAFCQSLGHDSEARQKMNDDYNYEVYDIADSFFMNVAVNMVAWIRANPANRDPGAYNGMYGFFDENANVQVLDFRRRYARDKQAVLEMVNDAYYWGNSSHFIEDHLARGINEARGTFTGRQTHPNVPLWLTFAGQIYLDTLKTVKIGSGWSEIKRFIHLTGPIVDAHPAACISLEPPVTKIREWLEMDPFQMFNTGNPKYKKYSHLRRHPLLCGLWLHGARLSFHDDGLKYAAVPGGVMITTQLYHAAHQEGLMRLYWKEMDTHWKSQGNSCFFVGDPPTDALGYWKNFCLTLGMSATSFNSNRRGGKVNTSKAGVRDMNYRGVTSHHLFPRIQAGRYGDRRLLDAEAVQEWILDGAEARGHHTDTEDAAESRDGMPLVHRLAYVLHSEVKDLKFNYFQLHDNCWALMTRIKDCLNIKDPEFFKKSKIDQGNLPFIVGAAFSMMAGKLNVDKATTPDAYLIRYEAEQFTKFLEEGGKKGRDKGRTVVEFEERGDYGAEKEEPEAEESTEHDGKMADAMAMLAMSKMAGGMPAELDQCRPQ